MDDLSIHSVGEFKNIDRLDLTSQDIEAILKILNLDRVYNRIIRMFDDHLPCHLRCSCDQQ